MEAPLQRLQVRAARAVRSAKAKEARIKYQGERDAAHDSRSRNLAIRRSISELYKDERTRRREDWELGPRLRPRRDIGSRRDNYATVPYEILYTGDLPEKWRTKTWLAEGDRVVVLAGRDYGRIGRVDQVDEKAQHVTVSGLNQIEVEVPKWARESEAGASHTAVPRPVPWKQVKLVHPVEDESGAFRDVVVEKLELRKYKGRDAETGKLVDKYQRIIPGLEEEVPWPKEPAKGKQLDTDSDTLRLTVDERTFTPRLLNAPMPPSVIDELRGKYSRLRTRHEPGYIARLEAEQLAGQRRRAALDAMALTPAQRAAAQYRATKPQTLPELSEDSLAAIGKVIAENGAAMGEAKAIDDAASTQPRR